MAASLPAGTFADVPPAIIDDDAPDVASPFWQDARVDATRMAALAMLSPREYEREYERERYGKWIGPHTTSIDEAPHEPLLARGGGITPGTWVPVGDGSAGFLWPAPGAQIVPREEELSTLDVDKSEEMVQEHG